MDVDSDKLLVSEDDSENWQEKEVCFTAFFSHLFIILNKLVL